MTNMLDAPQYVLPILNEIQLNLTFSSSRFYSTLQPAS